MVSAPQLYLVLPTHLSLLTQEHLTLVFSKRLGQ